MASHGEAPWNTPEEMVLYYRRALEDGTAVHKMFLYDSDAQYRRKVRAHAELLASDACGDVLEIGCGCGILLDHFVPPLRYTGIDIVPEFIDHARRRYPNRDFVCGNVLADAFQPADTVVMVGVVSSSPQRLSLLHRAATMSSRRLVFDYVHTTVVALNGIQIPALTSEDVDAALRVFRFGRVRAIPLGTSTTLTDWHRVG